MPISPPRWLGPLVLFLLSVLPVSAAPPPGDEAEAAKQISAFIQATKAGDATAIARAIRFPLDRRYPLPAIMNPEEFVQRYHEVFDDELIRMISASTPEKDWDPMGWHGYMLKNGLVWADVAGPIIAINHESATERALRRKLIAADRRTLPDSLQRFEEPVLKWDTKSYKLRIDDLGDWHYRLILWNADNGLSANPVLVAKGERIPDGSGGNHYYLFHHDNVAYRCDVVVLGTDESGIGRFSILKGDRTLKEESVLREY